MLKLKKIKPLFTSIITTAERYEDDETVNGVITRARGEMKPIQKVVAIGECVKTVNVGDYVMVNPKRYIRVNQERDNSIKDTMVESYKNVVSYDIPTVELDGVIHLYLQDRDIDFVVEDYEEVQQSDIIVPNKPKIVI